MEGTKPTLNDALALAAECHRGQRDKAGQPYIEHPLAVMRSLHGEVDDCRPPS